MLQRKYQRRPAAKTSWERHGKWYSKVVEESGSYQKEVILPGVLSLLGLRRGEDVLDIGCGEGFFAREFHKLGVNVLGVDASPELIALAKKKGPPEVLYRVADAAALPFLRNGAFDAAVIILALQNMEKMDAVLKEARRVLNPKGRLVIVLNHPAFRIPKLSGWGWDEEQKLQYRRMNAYMSETKVPIQMHPGERTKEVTWSFHRPLQSYVKALHGAGFAVTDMEEWVSHRVSERGPRAKAEDRARREIPLFLAIKAEPQR
ncbi:MAG: methyltransferase domain-containing protein [Candidatus Harrisonbacteria bacterium]|nr:methyltransferase domain-containing protein [Candidatus Harrisonbacteria bacterium]